ncbi:MAG TPA: hypothetical protein VGM39_18765 [Kofleriaceae bacterium]
MPIWKIAFAAFVILNALFIAYRLDGRRGILSALVGGVLSFGTLYKVCQPSVSEPAVAAAPTLPSP